MPSGDDALLEPEEKSLWLNFDLDMDRLMCLRLPLHLLSSISGRTHRSAPTSSGGEKPCRGLFDLKRLEETEEWWKEESDPLLMLPEERSAKDEAGAAVAAERTRADREEHPPLSQRTPPEAEPQRSPFDPILLLPKPVPPDILEELKAFAGEGFHLYAAGEGREERDPLEPVKIVKRRLWQRNYKRLRGLLQGENSAFRKRIGSIQKHLPLELRNLRGLPQRPGHSGPDPLDHTMRALVKSSSSPLMRDLSSSNPRYAEWVRCALLYHDLGKKMNPFDLSHAPLSARMARFHIESMDYSEEEVQVILRLIATHSLLGEMRRGTVSSEEACRILLEGIPRSIPSPLVVDLNYEVTKADIGSISVLRGISLEKEYRILRRLAGGG